ncbi:WD40 repeat domain-containing protein, partial [Dapis sp. BLCC M229]|uniref:WD40 repeat domain-containing protein n=1 Tax=Dapis sp. BLCC M229 TaxID=3400188 RepID=UPI003CF6EE51
ASDDKTVKLWNRQGELLQTLTGHQNWVTSVAFSPDGEAIASASDDDTVKLWNRQEELLQTLRGHQNSVRSVSFSPDGETIASASNDDTVKLWNPQGELLQTLTGHEAWVRSIAFNPDGKTIASASDDKTVKLWNRQGELFQTLTGHQNSVLSVAFSPDGKTVATASDDKTVKLWNRQGELLHTLTGHEDAVLSVVFSPNRETIASASDDKTVKLWNRHGKLLQTFTGHENWVSSVAFSPDGKTIASASDDKTVKLWNRQGELLHTLTGHQSSVRSVAFSPDGKTIASASDDKTVKLWNRQGELLQTLTGYQNSVRSVAFSPDGKIIATASDDKTVKLWKDLRIEDLTKRGCKWLNDYLITHPLELEELKICQTYGRKKVASRSWIIEGEKLARESQAEPEKFDQAVTAFKKALQWNPDLNLKPKVRAELLVKVEKLMEEGTQLARQGKIEAAIEKYKKAKEFDKVALIPTWQNIDPEAKAKYQATDELLNQGEELVKNGKVKEAIASYYEAEKIDPTQISASNWNTLCWNGSLYQKATDVMFACKKAFALNPKDGDIIDSRGLARALTANIEGAIADFQVFVEWTDNEEEKAQRQEWIKALEAGEDPFTEEVLNELKD